MLCIQWLQTEALSGKQGVIFRSVLKLDLNSSVLHQQKVSIAKSLQQLMSIKVTSIWTEQNQLVSYSAKERQSSVKYIVG